MRFLLAAALSCTASFAFAEGHTTPTLIANVSGPGDIAGTVRIIPSASGMMVIQIGLSQIPPGSHGVHIHETGDCSAEDFSSAGGHLAGDATHGVYTADGPHPGDLPNATVGDDGVMTVTYFNDRLTTDMLMDADGSAFIVHSGEDDYETQPAGAAGDRIACGVIAIAPTSEG